jgi:hypothetical protein
MPTSLAEDESPWDARLMAQLSRDSDKRQLKNPRTTLLSALCGLLTGTVTSVTWGTSWLLPALASVVLCVHLISRISAAKRTSDISAC